MAVAVQFVITAISMGEYKPAQNSNSRKLWDRIARESKVSPNSAMVLVQRDVLEFRDYEVRRCINHCA